MQWAIMRGEILVRVLALWLCHTPRGLPTKKILLFVRWCYDYLRCYVDWMEGEKFESEVIVAWPILDCRAKFISFLQRPNYNNSTFGLMYGCLYTTACNILTDKRLMPLATFKIIAPTKVDTTERLKNKDKIQKDLSQELIDPRGVAVYDSVCHA